MITALTFAAEFALCYAALHLAAALVDVAVHRVTALDRGGRGGYGRPFDPGSLRAK
jgi:hypothetical protein